MVVRIKKTNKFEARITRNKYVAAFILVNMLNQIFLPGISMALTNGPVQPTAMSFEPVTTNQMVDLASGDFTYNIPLFELPGPNGSYPFNLFYNSGVTMDQEASMYGLGWNLNPGMINKNTRGIDDQSNGDEIEITEDLKQNITFGGSANFAPEFFGFDSKKAGLKVGAGIKFYYNNYKGVGAGLSASLSYVANSESEESCTKLFPGKLNLGIDSQDGTNASFSYSLRGVSKNSKQSYTYGLGLSSKRGLSISTNVGHVKERDKVTKAGVAYKENITRSGGASFSFAETSFTPILSNEMRSLNASFSIGGGPEASGFFAKFGFGVFYNQSWLANLKDPVSHKSYGYNYLHNSDSKGITDFNREKDAALHKWSKNIGVSNYTYDTYVVKGQGIGSSFRPFRTKFGSIADPKKVSYGGGAHVNIEFGGGAVAEVGGGGGINFNRSYVESWADSKNEIYNELNFTDPVDFSGRSIETEKFYYKSHGEMTTIKKSELSKIGGERPIAAKFNDKHRVVDKIYELKNKFVSNSGSELDVIDSRSKLRDSEREKRNTNILELKNSDLSSLSDEGIYNFSYYEIGDLNNYVEQNLVRGNRSTRKSNIGENKSHDISDHTGAFSVLNSGGLRYNYAIPVYNNSKVEEITSVEGRDDCIYKIDAPESLFSEDAREGIDFSEQYYKKTIYPAEVQNYLLTNILGTDYVDVDDIAGPSDGDKGYWVKFNYVKDEDYKWRAPYDGALYMPGSELTGSDDKASYTFGSRENYYLATAETETHIAKFFMSDRDDARAAKGQYDDNGLANEEVKKSYKVDSVKLYVKADYLANNATTALQTTHFRYNYTLCPSVLNNFETRGGKLTLTKVWTTYQKNKRGELSPYTFNYGKNYWYEENLYNRWGGYKMYNGGACKNIQNPYVEQFKNDHFSSNNEFDPELAAIEHQEKMNEYASAWNMNKITLPSGSEINIEYESDDYGYVQHKQAGQMFDIVSTGNTNGNNVLYTESGGNNDWDPNTKTGNDHLLKMYFNLEKPIKVVAHDADPAKTKELFFNNYIKPTKTPEGDYQLYFKTKVHFRTNFADYVSGFVKLNVAPDKYGLDQNTIESYNGEDYITRGYVTMQPIESNYWMQRKAKYFHPISFHAWQYMQQVKPDLITAVSTNGGPADNIAKKSGKDRALAIKSFLGAFVQAGQMFKSYTKQCFNREFANKIELSDSWIRLGSPDKKKFGGGSRVSKVYMKDNWGEVDPITGSEIEYGQVYDYTTTEDDQIISSGVASFEPMIGGDENILRYARVKNRKIALQASSVSSFNYPVNESLFPGARVVYGKVTTRSIGTQLVMDNKLNGVNDQRIASRAKSGVKVNTFATCKDYPTIVEETKIQKDNFNLWIPIPFIGLIQNGQMGASQGYSIISNDMAGKPLSEETYKVKSDGALGELVSSVNYEYQSTPEVYQNENILRLDNEVEVIKDEFEPDPNSSLSAKQYVRESKYMGVEYDLHSDFRHSQSVSGSIGFQLNVNLVFFFIPIPTVTFLPEFNLSTSDMKTGVINKIIHKSGILKSVTASDGQSTVKTENLLYDDLTGSVVLTKVNNNYEAPVYSMNIPAHWKYEGMQAASENSGIEFPFTFGVSNNNLNMESIDFVTDQTLVFGQGGVTVNRTIVSDQEFDENVSEGDELLIKHGNTSYFGVMNKNHVIYVPNFPGGLDGQTGLTATAKVVRSKKRNLLSAIAGNIVALQDPTKSIELEAVNSAFITELEDFLNKAFIVPYDINYDVTNGYSTQGLIDAGYPLVADKFSLILRDPNNTQGVYLTFVDKNGSECSELLTFIGPGDGNTNGRVRFELIELDDKIVLETLWKSYGNPETYKESKDLSCVQPVDPTVFCKSQEVLQASAVEFSDSWTYNESVQEANPYINGEEGIWRVDKNHYYKDERYSTDKRAQYASGEQDLSRDGVFRGNQLTSTTWDKQFYLFDWNKGISQHEKWVANENITKYNRDGFAIESKDILGNFSFAKYGYGGNLVTMVGANAQEDEVFFEDFENENSFHVSGTSAIRIGESVVKPHSGSKSLSTGGSLNGVFKNLKLKAGKEYSFSCWIDGGTKDSNGNYNFSGISFWNSTTGFFTDNNGQVTAMPVGEIIEGWQKVEVVFSVPANMPVDGNTSLVTNSNFMIDDVRVCPFKAAVKTYVYNPDNFRLVAELDNNNFATYYFYDSQGSLHLTKVETSKGIMTVSESRGHIKN